MTTPAQQVLTTTTRRSDAPQVAAPRAVHSPLLVRLCNWVGEVVLLVPALRRLQAAGFDLQLVGKSWAAPLLEGAGWPVIRHERSVLGMARKLRAWRAQLPAPLPASRLQGVLFTRSLSSALEFRLAGIAATGYAQDGRGLLMARSVRRQRGLHAADEYWQLVDAFLRTPAAPVEDMSLPLSERQRRQAGELLAAHGLIPGQYVLLCPFSGSDDRERRKVWPGFGELAARLGSVGRQLLVCPGPGEEERVRAVLPTAVSCAGVDLGVYAALLAGAHCVVANDTGPGHIAAAVGANLIGIYGPHSSLAAWGPRGRRVRCASVAGGWPGVDEIARLVAS